ncbi:DUF1934 domain-containing protein [Fructilactobacillus myrtifloralis]|uniref:DUF1934 domain-containing protein n=1 Tax=Fructilactobacillus myrtifloralis TaxID=2940301 RepID=A0ABY5BNU2_9LACO|nr:DUF1934 domain-containing protein [Fructilactobacillus myrtifloralis]USS84871.1 DUF1934 domain-containing protein [Fructilactobacillus myrtifloralis]
MAQSQPGHPVHIEGHTILHQAGEQEEYNFTGTGQLVQLGETIYLRFNEQNESPAVPVTYKIDGDESLRISRRGESHLTLHLEPGRRTNNVDVTPYGKLELAAETTSLQLAIDLEQRTGSIAADYQIFTDGTEVGNHQIRLHFYP